MHSDGVVTVVNYCQRSDYAVDQNFVYYYRM